MADPAKIRRDPGGRVDPGDGQGPDRPLRRGADSAGARGRLHRRVGGADTGRPEHHIDKWEFTRSVRVRLRGIWARRCDAIAEGAAMIRTKGEAGTGDIVNAVATCAWCSARSGGSARSPKRSLRRGEGASAHRSSSSSGWPRTGAFRWSRSRPAESPLRPTRRCACSSARTASSSAPGSSSRATLDKRANAIVEATTHFNDAEVLARVSAGLGEPMVGISPPTTRARRSCSRPAAGSAARKPAVFVRVLPRSDRHTTLAAPERGLAQPPGQLYRDEAVLTSSAVRVG